MKECLICFMFFYRFIVGIFDPAFIENSLNDTFEKRTSSISEIVNYIVYVLGKKNNQTTYAFIFRAV